MADKPSGTGIELKPAHFPGRAPVDTYGNGGFRFAGMSHQGSILCLPSGIYGWSAVQASELKTSDFQQVFDEDGVEILLIGTGVDLLPLPDRIRTGLQKRGIRGETMSTGAASRTFNVLLAESRAVGAALLAID